MSKSNFPFHVIQFLNSTLIYLVIQNIIERRITSSYNNVME